MTHNIAILRAAKPHWFRESFRLRDVSLNLDAADRISEGMASISIKPAEHQRMWEDIAAMEPLLPESFSGVPVFLSPVCYAVRAALRFLVDDRHGEEIHALCNALIAPEDA